MRVHTMRINKEIFYLCRQNDDKTYQEPIKIIATFSPTTQEGDIVAYGSKFPEYARTQEAYNDLLGSIKANDKIYYGKPLPLEHDKTQTTKTSANFIVSGQPTITKNTIDIRYRKIPNR